MATKGTHPKVTKTPKLRFPEFSGAWETKKLGEVTKLFSSRNTKLINAKVYSVTNTNGFVIQTDHFSKVVAGENLSGYKIIKKNDFAYNPARINVGSIAHFKDDIGIISSLYVCFRTTSEVSDIFLNYILQLAKTKHNIAVNGEGGVRIYLWYPLFAQIKITIPSSGEQNKIASFLSAIDELIENTKEQKEMFESYKRGIMQKIFSREIRFKDEKGNDFPDWKSKKFASVATFLKGKGISKDEIDLSGKNKCIRYGELYTEYTEVICEIKSKTNTAPEDSFVGKKNDILIPSSGETAMDIASVSCLMEDDVLLGGDMNVIRLNPDQCGAFFSYYLTNFKNKEIAKLAQGNAVVHLYASHLKNLKLGLPSFPEQQKIAAHLSSIDNLIKSKERQIIMMSEWKRGLMQDLFV